MRLLYFLSTNLGGLITHHWSGWLLDTSLRSKLISISVLSVAIFDFNFHSYHKAVAALRS